MRPITSRQARIMISPYYEEDGVELYCGDALSILQLLPAESVDMVMTSPPYYGLRNYHVDGQIGLEAIPLEYLQKLWTVFNEVKRVLKNNGTIWVNIGDTYGGSSNGSWNAPIQIIDQKYLTPPRKTQSQKKCLLLVPERFAIGMTERGWVLRNRICWYKPNHMPSSVQDRFTCTWDYLYFFTKREKYYFNLDVVRIKMKNTSPDGSPDNKYLFANKKINGARIDLRPKEYRNKVMELTDKGIISGSGRIRAFFNNFSGKTNLKGKNPGDHWSINTRGFSGSHFATYPKKLCEIPILAGCPEGGTVLDMFSGSGTTGIVAKELRRNCILIDLSELYCELAKQRIKQTIKPLFVISQ